MIKVSKEDCLEATEDKTKFNVTGRMTINSNSSYQHTAQTFNIEQNLSTSISKTQ
jgi:hypothetical protein